MRHDRTIALPTTVTWVAAFAGALLVTPGVAHAGDPVAQLPPESAPTAEPPPPYEPSDEDLACGEDADCMTTCQYSAYSCCPTYCAPCTFVLNRQAAQRRTEQCAQSDEECPTVGACAQQPSERGIPRCVESVCTVELVPVGETP